MKEVVYLLFCVATGMIGYQIHHDKFWSVIDAIFAPIALIKWFIYHEINVKIIKQTFEFFVT
jgi:hypothetical protein